MTWAPSTATMAHLDLVLVWGLALERLQTKLSTVDSQGRASLANHARAMPRELVITVLALLMAWALVVCLGLWAPNSLQAVVLTEGLLLHRVLGASVPITEVMATTCGRALDMSRWGNLSANLSVWASRSV